ncbi:HK97 family phage prohead protease, partial [Collinsella sp. LCP21S3_C3]|uniref:HK97 family phage prohead protease n=1 Tax=Collinsella sp. LCP21S3_C3 TaxID=3438771 RepID=UPI003F93030A
LMSDQVCLSAPEVRTFAGLEFRDVDATESLRYLEGRAVPYGQWQDVGWYMEQIQPRAFAKSIREAARKLPLLLWHDNRSFPVGVSERWTETDDGLDVVWRLDIEDDLAMTAARKARDGMLTGLSVGFASIEDERELDDDGLMWVKRIEARLLEVSLTPTPAYAGAKVS